MVSAGDGITISGEGTTDDPKVITNDEPFTEADSDVLGELANTARHTVEDDLVLRLQYGAEHLFGGRDRIITGAASIDGYIFMGSEEGFVNDERGINITDLNLHDLTTNNNDPDTGGNWYFFDGGSIRIRQRSSSGTWSNATPFTNSTGLTNANGIGISADPENRTGLYFLHIHGDGLRIESAGISTSTGTGSIAYQADHDINRGAINSVLSANNLGNISTIRSSDEHGIPVTAILRINTPGVLTGRTFTLDTGYLRKVGIRGNVQGLVPTEKGFWIATEHTVYEYHESGYNLPEPGENDDGKSVTYDNDNDDYILSDAGGGSFSTVAHGSGDIEPDAENEWTATGIQIPTTSEADFLLVQFGRSAQQSGRKRGDWHLVEVGGTNGLRGLNAGTAGATPNFQEIL